MTHWQLNCAKRIAQREVHNTGGGGVEWEGERRVAEGRREGGIVWGKEKILIPQCQTRSAARLLLHDCRSLLAVDSSAREILRSIHQSSFTWITSLTRTRFHRFESSTNSSRCALACTLRDYSRLDRCNHVYTGCDRLQYVARSFFSCILFPQIQWYPQCTVLVYGIYLFRPCVLNKLVDSNFRLLCTLKCHPL